MTNTLIHGIIDALSGSVSKEVIVFLISMIPILELRGALLVAGPILGVKVSTAIPLCIIGNIIPVPFILLLITPVFNWMKGTKTFNRWWINWNPRRCGRRTRLKNMNSGDWFYLLAFRFREPVHGPAHWWHR